MPTKAAQTADSGPESLTFEQAMKELEEIVRRLEGGSGDLESSIRDYQRGTELQRHCQQKLADAKLRVEAVLKDEGKVSLQPFETQNQ